VRSDATRLVYVHDKTLFYIIGVLRRRRVQGSWDVSRLIGRPLTSSHFRWAIHDTANDAWLRYDGRARELQCTMAHGDKIPYRNGLKAGGSRRCDIVSELAKYYIAKWSWYKRSFSPPATPPAHDAWQSLPHSAHF
jgi:hypothetical protein